MTERDELGHIMVMHGYSARLLRMLKELLQFKYVQR
jgi:hypothetical protein